MKKYTIFSKNGINITIQNTRRDRNSARKNLNEITITNSNKTRGRD